jgi:hypothetical protein
VRHALVLLALLWGVAWAQPERPLLDTYLTEGRLGEGVIALSQRLETRPNDQQARFSLGVLHFLEAVEHLAQAGHHYGVFADAGLPFLRLPTPPNPNPARIDYRAFRQIFVTLERDLSEAAEALESVTSSTVKLPVRFGLIRLDLDGDGTATNRERFWTIYTRYNAQAQGLEPRALPITFDLGDARWLQGYTHLLLALVETYLAHDGQELFERTAQLFYPKVETPYALLERDSSLSAMGADGTQIADLIAFIHLLRLEVREPERLRAALGHLEAVVSQSRASWRAILAETDDDHEWLPNPRQQSVVPVRVNQAMIEGWLELLGETEAILAGEKLLPHWRVRDRGINLRRVFLEPRTFDAVLWAQGSAAVPYLEEGELTRGDTWGGIMNLFDGNFFGFALWFN